MEFLQPWHIVVVLVIAVLFFGGKRLPELGKGIGEGWKGFKEGLSGKTDATPASGDTAHTVTPKAADELKPPPAA